MLVATLSQNLVPTYRIHSNANFVVCLDGSRAISHHQTGTEALEALITYTSKDRDLAETAAVYQRTRNGWTRL
jgi:hypothetical protein